MSKVTLPPAFRSTSASPIFKSKIRSGWTLQHVKPWQHSSNRSSHTALACFSYRESMHVMIASLDLASRGKGDRKLLCHREAACSSFGTSAIITTCTSQSRCCERAWSLCACTEVLVCMHCLSSHAGARLNSKSHVETDRETTRRKRSSNLSPVTSVQPNIAEWAL